MQYYSYASSCLLKFLIFLQGDVQLLKIASRPDEAYEICKKYAPNCDILLGNTRYNITSGSTATTTGDSYYFSSSSRSSSIANSTSGTRGSIETSTVYTGDNMGNNDTIIAYINYI